MSKILEKHFSIYKQKRLMALRINTDRSENETQEMLDLCKEEAEAYRLLVEEYGEELKIMKHTVLGGKPRIRRNADDIRPGFYRNRFVTGEGSDDYEICNRLVDKGFMGVMRKVEVFGLSDVFWLTDKGLDEVEKFVPLIENKEVV